MKSTVVSKDLHEIFEEKATSKGAASTASLLAPYAMALSIVGTLVGASTAQAQTTTNFATWTMPTTFPDALVNPPANASTARYAYGASGSVLDPISGQTVTFTLSGEVMSMTSATWSTYGAGATMTSTFVSTESPTAPSAGAGMITQTGFTSPTYQAHTLTFDRDVSNAVLLLWSLGNAQGNTADASDPDNSALTFTQPFNILSSNGLMVKSGNATDGYTVLGAEGMGVIQFLGTYRSISWNVTAPEYYSGFTIGLTPADNAQAGVTQSLYSFPDGTLPPVFTASTDIKTDSGNTQASLGSSLNRVFDGGRLTLGGDETGNFTIKSGGGRLDPDGGTYSVSGVIANEAGASGAMNIGGASGGKVTFSGANTYTGATTIDAGSTLALSGSGAIAQSSGVAVNGTFDVSGTTSGASVKGISGSGSVTLGARTLALTNATGTFSGTIEGTGGLTVSGGSQTLTGTNTFSGTTSIASGATLSVGSGGTSGALGAGDITNRGTLVLDRSNAFTFANSLTGGGDLTIRGGGTARITSATGTLGAMTVTGNTTAYFNTVTLNSSHAEIVALDADLSPSLLFSGTSLTVDAGSSLRGAGFIDAPTTVSGTLRPGNSPGTLVFGAPVVQTSTSVLSLDIDGPGTGSGAGNYSSVIVNGTGNTYTADGEIRPILRGITGSANNDYSPAVGSIFTVVSATGGALGSFDVLTQPASGLLAGTQFDTIYNTNTIQLVITPSDLGGISGLTPNQTAIGTDLQRFRPTPGVRPSSTAVATVFDALFKNPLEAYPGLYDRMSFSIYGDALLAQTRSVGATTASVGEQLAMRRGSAVKEDGKVQRFCLDGDVPTSNPELCRQVTVWGTGTARLGRSFTYLGDAGFKTSDGGMVLGADLEFARDVRMGLFAGYSKGSVESDRTASKADTSTFSGGFYGAVDGDAAYVNGIAGVVFGEQNVSRRPLDTPVAGKQDVSGGVFAGEAGLRYRNGEFLVEPNIGVRAAFLERASLTETGSSPLAVALAADTATSAQGLVGTRLIHRTGVANGMTFSSQISGAYAHEIGDQGTISRGAFSGFTGSSVAVTSSLSGRNAFLGSLAFTLADRDRLDVFVKYDADLRTNAINQSVSAGLRVTW